MNKRINRRRQQKIYLLYVWISPEIAATNLHFNKIFTTKITSQCLHLQQQQQQQQEKQQQQREAAAAREAAAGAAAAIGEAAAAIGEASAALEEASAAIGEAAATAATREDVGMRVICAHTPQYYH